MLLINDCIIIFGLHIIGQPPTWNSEYQAKLYGSFPYVKIPYFEDNMEDYDNGKVYNGLNGLSLINFKISSGSGSEDKEYKPLEWDQNKI